MTEVSPNNYSIYITEIIFDIVRAKKRQYYHVTMSSATALASLLSCLVELRVCVVCVCVSCLQQKEAGLRSQLCVLPRSSSGPRWTTPHDATLAA